MFRWWPREAHRKPLYAAYQPRVDLHTEEVVGYESLARGENGTFPIELFQAARRDGTISELDWEARLAGVSGALEAGLPAGLRLFLNVEPETLGDPCPASGVSLWRRAQRDLSVVLEITERALTTRPAELLRSVAEARGRGWGIALDDVGADTRSLALMPFLRPDVIKFDLRLVQRRATREIAQIVHAVRAEAERTGAVLLGEGIETEAHLDAALGIGATLGQGYRFGRPGALRPSQGIITRPLSFNGELQPAPTTPFELIGAGRPTIRAGKRLLVEMSKQLEEEAASVETSCVVLSAFQDGEFFTRATQRRYELLAHRAAFVAALGAGLHDEPAPGVAGRDLTPDDPLRGEWTIAVVAPHFAACLSALDRRDNVPEAERTFDYVLTFERDLVLGAARSLLLRV